jgi:hypothetical protein
MGRPAVVQATWPRSTPTWWRPQATETSDRRRGRPAGQFADAGLLDEIQLSIASVTLGGGAPLLPRRLLASDLTLVSLERQGQFVAATYRVTRAGGQE